MYRKIVRYKAFLWYFENGGRGKQQPAWASFDFEYEDPLTQLPGYGADDEDFDELIFNEEEDNDDDAVDLDLD